MKQVSDSLLTRCPILKLPDASAFPRDTAGANGRHFTPFFVHRWDAGILSCILPGLSCPPRSYVRSRLGEGRIRSLLHRLRHGWLVALVILPSILMLNGADKLVINLKEEAAVSSNTILLKDVADLENIDPESRRILAQTALGPAPEFGSATILTRNQIQERIQKGAAPSAEAAFSGAGAVQVRVQGKPADSSEIASILKSDLLKKNQWKDAEIGIRFLSGVKGIELPPDGAELRFSSNPTIVGRNRILVPIEVVHAGKILRCFWVTAEVSVRAATLVASRNIAVNKVIAPDDFVQTVTEIRDLRAAYVVRPEEILGKASRRNFSAGDPLTREAFSDPFLVRHGETVQLRLERNGIVLTTLARAEQDGKLGQVISVRNLDFSAILKAQVTGRAAVKLE